MSDQENQGQPPAGLVPMAAPSFWSSYVQIGLAGNDAMLVFLHLQPSMVPGGPAAQSGAQLAFLQPVATMHMSVQSAKDMAVILNDWVQNYEKTTGRVIETEFTKKRAAE